MAYIGTCVSMLVAGLAVVVWMVGIVAPSGPRKVNERWPLGCDRTSELLWQFLDKTTSHLERLRSF